MAHLNSFCFYVLIFFASGIYAQDNALIVKTPQNLDDVLERKLSLDKKREKQSISIQIFSGNMIWHKCFWTLFFSSHFEKTQNSLLKPQTTKFEQVCLVVVLKVYKRLMRFEKNFQIFLAKALGQSLKLFLHCNFNVGLYGIARFDIFEILDLQATVIPFCNFLGIVFKSL